MHTCLLCVAPFSVFRVPVSESRGWLYDEAADSHATETDLDTATFDIEFNNDPRGDAHIRRDLPSRSYLSSFAFDVDVFPFLVLLF